MNINYSIEQCRQNIYNVINNSQLPIGIVYYLLKDIGIDVENAYKATILKEKQEQLNKDKEE